MLFDNTWSVCYEGKCGGICVCDSACMAEYLLCNAEYLLCTENGEGVIWSLAVKISAKSNFLVATLEEKD